MHDAKWLFPQAGAPKERSLLLGEEEKATLYELKKVYVYSENALMSPGEEFVPCGFVLNCRPPRHRFDAGHFGFQNSCGNSWLVRRWRR
jgi:hypothetical protein